MNKIMRDALAATAIQFAAVVPLVTVGASASAADPAFNIEEAITSASTKADHENIAAYYEREAADLQQKLERHKRMQQAYKHSGHGKRRGSSMEYHCSKLISNYEAAIAEQLELAQGHRAMADESAQ